MVSDVPGSYCQNCLTWNPGERETCRKCGTRLLILAGDQTWEDEPEETDGGEDLEEHLLERITALEETLRRAETYLETVSDQLGKLERSEVMLRNGLMALVQEMEQNRQLDAHAFSQRWESLVEETTSPRRISLSTVTRDAGYQLSVVGLDVLTGEHEEHQRHRGLVGRVAFSADARVAGGKLLYDPNVLIELAR